MKRTYRWGLALAAALAFCVVACFVTRPYFVSLTAAERLMVGSWTYISPDHAAKTMIVYHFAADRRVLEEHYYLTSASPTIPRISMAGKWNVDQDGRLTVEPDSGLWYARDSLSGWLNEYFDDGRQAWVKPILTRFYRIKSANRHGIQVDCSRSGGGQTSISMLPFRGDATAIESH